MPVITISPNLENVTPLLIKTTSIYRRWIERYHKGWSIDAVNVHSVIFARGMVIQIHATVHGVDAQGEERTAACFMRGETVEILPILIGPDKCKYVVFVEQPRVPVMQDVISTPAGRLEDGEDSLSAALREVQEEVSGGLDWNPGQLLNRLITGSDLPFLVSPGGSDESVDFVVIRAYVDEEQLQRLQGLKAGLAEENEQTVVHVVPLREALRFLASQGNPDLKSAFGLMAFQLLVSRQPDECAVLSG